MFETVEKTVSEIIDFNKSKTNGSKFTKTFIQENMGDIPVYGASLDETEVSYGYVKDGLEGIKYFKDCLTWNIDGSAGIFYRKGYFSLSEKVIPLIPFENIQDLIDLDFLKYSIMYSKEFAEFGFSNKAGKGKLGEIKINIPIKSDGSFDLEKQKELAKKYKDIEEKKKVLLEKIEILKKYKILIEADTSIATKDVDLNSMITHNNGKANYTKEFCQENKGDIPLYSANNSKPIAYMNKADYNGKYLSYSKNGCAGYISIMEGAFSINGDRCVLTLNKGYEKVDLLYLKYFLEPIFRANIKGRIGINGKNEYTKLNSTMIKKLKIQVPIPIKSDGSFDLEKQQELAMKYANVESIKQNIYNQIKELTSIMVD